jgi:hypothetical protein
MYNNGTSMSPIYINDGMGSNYLDIIILLDE